ncbi:MAG: ATP-binding cassette domain-containing protein [Pseudomonadota bacterium]
MSAVFTLDNLTFSVPERVLLDGINFDLPAGQVTGLVGHNGSGKSTLIKILARQIQPTGGTVSFEGRNLGHWQTRAFARRLAYLPQHLPAAEGLLAEELVALGRYPWHGVLGRAGQADRDAVAGALTACGLTDLRQRQVDTLSGGEAQRVWLGMMVAQDAACLLLDEPISALDIAHQIEVLTLVRKLSRDSARSVVVVLHDLNMAARFCDHIVALRRGQVAFSGTPGDMMTPEVLQCITGTDMQVLERAGGLPVAIPE